MLKLGLIAIGVLAALVVLFLFIFSYTSPVREAGRDFKKDVRAYRGADIESADDVYERLEVLDSHFNSATSDKVQDADKTEIYTSDMETLFGEPHEVVEEAEMTDANTVYRYFYDDFTVNFHQRGFTYLDEYVAEQYNTVLYEPDAMDELFVEVINNHQSQVDKADERFEPILKENVSQLIGDKTPTRNIRQIGWRTWIYNQHDYFDNGQGDYGPREYLSLQYEEEESVYLAAMERRYEPGFSENDTVFELEKKNEAYTAFRDSVNQEEPNDEEISVRDLTDAFGEMALINYVFRDGYLYFTWLLEDSEFPEGIVAVVPVTETDNLSEFSDLLELEVVELSKESYGYIERVFKNDGFIGTYE